MRGFISVILTCLALGFSGRTLALEETYLLDPRRSAVSECTFGACEALLANHFSYDQTATAARVRAVDAVLQGFIAEAFTDLTEANWAQLVSRAGVDCGFLLLMKEDRG